MHEQSVGGNRCSLKNENLTPKYKGKVVTALVRQYLMNNQDVVGTFVNERLVAAYSNLTVDKNQALDKCWLTNCWMPTS